MIEILKGANGLDKQLKDINSDADVRHFIYITFSKTSRAPTTNETAVQFGVPISSVENAYDRLAQEHQIALAPGSYSIWMAHPFSNFPTNYVTEIGGNRYWGN